VASWPRFVAACPVCFGITDDKNYIQAYLWGGGILVAATFMILAVLFYAVFRIEKTRAMALKVRELGLSPHSRNGHSRSKVEVPS
jgi:uncharacterized protein (DUF58 family)